MSVAAFIDVQPTEQDLATELAITLAEFCVAENEALFLMADRITALEIGISLIGASESRTVEDSEHRVPTIVLLPFIPRANSLDNEVLRYSADLNVGGDLEDLFDLGVFARGGEAPAGFDFGPNPASAFEEVIARATPNRLVGLGQSSVYWQAINAGIERTPRSFRPQLITVEGFGSEAISSRFERLLVRTPELSGVRRSEGHFRESDDLEEIRLHSERDGALVGAFLEQLISLSRPGSAPLRRHL